MRAMLTLNYSTSRSQISALSISSTTILPATLSRFNLSYCLRSLCTLYVPILLPVGLWLVWIADRGVQSWRYRYHLQQSFLQLSPGCGTKPKSAWICQHLCDQRYRSESMENRVWWISCSTRSLTRSLRSLVRCRVGHSKRNSISSRSYV